MQNYTSLIQQYITHSNEKDAVKTELKKIIKNKRFDSFLDIGCGTGEIIKPILQNFNKIILLDTEDRRQDIIKNNPKVKFIKKDFLRFEAVEKFDVILATYILWEIPFQKWNLFFSKTNKFLKSNGIIIIIDEYSKNKYDNPFFDFNIYPEKNADYPDFVSYLSKKELNFKINKFKSQIFSENEKEMYEILKFFFQSPEQKNFYFNNKKKIINDLKSKCKKNNCIIDMQHIVCIISQNPKIHYNLI